ncbi:MAG: hypothetical protein M0P23_06445 [Bacteroidales bacterium]|nr:hypothetical protein [Bacteroidales bacterium]
MKNASCVMFKKALPILFMVVFLLLFFAPPLLTVNAKSKYETVDPYKYLGVDSFEEVMELIQNKKDNDGNPFNATRLTFSVEPMVDVIDYNPRTREEFYKYAEKGFGFSGTIDMDLKNGFTVSFPFNTGEYIYEDYEYGFHSVEYAGEILLRCRVGTPTYTGRTIHELTAYFFGKITEKDRSERERPGELIIDEYEWERENPNGIALRYSAEYLPPSYSANDNLRKSVLLKLHYAFSPVEWVVKLRLISMDISEVVPEGSGSVDTDADKNAGETGVTIPEALAIVIIGGAAAMAGAGAGGKSGDDNGKKKNRYKMCLRKDFGDAIRYDTQPVTVYARIVEITPEGEEIDRPDLSARIEMFSGGGLKVESTAIADNYMGALVCAESVPGGQNPDRGVLSIRFSGEVGSFQNNVTFRLVGDARIHFPERGKMLTPTTYMLFGDNGDYQVPVELIDFTLPPQKVRLELPGNQPFTAETERIDDTHYIIQLHNTSPIQTDKAQPQQIFMVFVYAENEKESAHDNFLVNLLPEGLSLRPFTGCPIDENGRLQVVCSLAPEQGEDEVEIEKTEFQLVLCVSQIDESGRKQAILVDSNSMDCRFDPMKAQSEKLQNLLKAFVYEMDFSEAKRTGIFRICPKRQLPQDDRLDYDIALPVSCDYKDQTYTLDIPIRLLGDKLLPMAEKSEEIALLIKRIRKFVDEEERAALIRGFKNDLPKMSATDVRLLSKSLVYATQAEVYKANMHLLNAEMLDWVCWGLDWYKWIGDQAISVIISKLSYNYAPFVEAIVMPAKDLLVEHMGIWLSNYISGSPSPSAEFDLEQLESTGLTMIENILTNLIDGKTEPKKAAQILSVYLVIRTAHAYFYETNDDGSPIGIYGAVASAFGDLTAQAFKIILGTKLEQLAKNPATTKMFGGYADEFVKGLFPAEFYNNGGEWEFDLIKKYIEEITVLASAKVYSGIQEGAEQDTVVGDIIVTLFENTENPEKTVRIAVNPLDLGKEFFDYIFDRLFGMFSFADSAVESPKDPPCILA